MKSPKDIDEYIAGCPNEVQATLKKLRVAIKKAMPKAEEAISYGIPAFNLNGCRIYFAAWKNHIALYPITPSVKTAFAKEFDSYDVEKGTIRFPLDKPFPLSLISNIVKLRIKEESEESDSHFPKMAAPASRALKNAKIKTLKGLSKWSEEEILELHGMGPSTIPKLRDALKAKGLSFRK